MKLSIKVLLAFVMTLSLFVSTQVLAKDESLVCFYQENEDGELEYVCVDSNELSPCGLGCMPPCQNPDD